MRDTSRRASTLAAVLSLPLAVGGAAGFGPVASSPPAAFHVPTEAFRDGPPAGVTGGSGEDSCYACHFDLDENAGSGGVTVAGFPERFQPGDTYELEVTLVHAGMGAGGFQLAVRDAASETQAGEISVSAAEAERISLQTVGEVQFAQHRLPGVDLSVPDTARWTMSWVAPEAGGPVVLNAAAVAADDDESQFGDLVYTFEARASPAGR